MLLARRRGLAVGVSCVALVVAFVAAIALGSVSIPLRQVVAILAGGHADQPAWRTIVVEFRLPKAITAALAGAGLGVAGLQLQTLFRNPLADPFILGISSGASLGVAFVVLAAGGAAGSTLLAGLGPLADLGVAGGAVVGSALVMAIVLAVARRVRSSVTVLIVGLMVGYLTTAIVNEAVTVFPDITPLITCPDMVVGVPLPFTCGFTSTAGRAAADDDQTSITPSVRTKPARTLWLIAVPPRPPPRATAVPEQHCVKSRPWRWWLCWLIRWWKFDQQRRQLADSHSADFSRKHFFDSARPQGAYVHVPKQWRAIRCDWRANAAAPCERHV